MCWRHDHRVDAKLSERVGSSSMLITGERDDTQPRFGGDVTQSL